MSALTEVAGSGHLAKIAKRKNKQQKQQSYSTAGINYLHKVSGRLSIKGD